MEKSRLVRPGPRATRREELPIICRVWPVLLNAVPGTENANGLKKLSTPGLATKVGWPCTRSGTLKELNTEACTLVKMSVGTPVRLVRMPFNCQPPTISPIVPAEPLALNHFLPGPHGNSYPPLNAKICATSIGATDRSRSR